MQQYEIHTFMFSDGIVYLFDSLLELNLQVLQVIISPAET